MPREETILLLFADVLRAIGALARFGLTHGGITPDTVLWEPAREQFPGRAQLIDLGRVTPVGKPRDLSLPAVWCAPPPGAAAHPGHDVYQAALLVHTVATREPPTDPAGMRARLADGPNEFLRRLLAGTFADDPAMRPAAAQLLDRITGFQATAPAITIPRQPAAPGHESRSFSHPFAYTGTQATGANPRADFRRMVADKRAFRQRQQSQAAVVRRFVRDSVDLLWHRQTSMRTRLALIGVVLGVLAVLVFLVMQMIGG
jgi:hypothetical protein